MNIWAFNSAEEEYVRDMLMDSLKKGKSRFGWSSADECNLKIKDNWTRENSKQLFLLDVQQGDWIVHVNMPVWGHCVAIQVTGEYDFDEGLECEWDTDFRHCIPVDPSTMLEFDRRDQNVLPSVNLRPRSRYHRIYAVEDFIQSLENLKHNNVTLSQGQLAGEFHLMGKTEKFLSEISSLIHDMNKSKNLEIFMAKVFRNIPNVVSVHENGFGWSTDHGADLIVKIRTSLESLDFENTVVVQVKSYSGSMDDLNAVEQVKCAIEKYGASAGMIVTTADKTESLEKEIEKVSKSIGVPIDLLSGAELVRFVLRNAPNMLFKLERNR